MLNWFGYNAKLLLVGGLGVSLSVGVFGVLLRHAESVQERVLEQQITSYADALADSVDGQMLVLSALRGVFAGPVSRSEFASALRGVQPLLPSLGSVAWAVAATGAEAPRFEWLSRYDGLPSYRVHNADGSQPAPDADLLVLHSFGTRAAEADGLGLNLLSLPGRRAAFERARDSGQPMAVGPVSRPNLSAVLPIYSAGGEPRSVEQRRDRIAGALVADFPIAALLDDTFARLGPPSADLYVIDAAAPPEHRLIQSVGGEGRTAAAPLAEVLGEDETLFRTVWVAGRQWVLLLRPPPATIFGNDRAAWVALAAGLLLTMAATAHLAHQRRAQAALAAESAAKGNIAAALADSERRFRLALDASRVMVYSQDLQLRYTWGYNIGHGLEPSVYLGKRAADLFPAAEAERFDAIKRQVIDTGEGFSGGVKVTLMGKQLFVDLKVERLQDDSGAVVGVICAASDVTEDRIIRHELQKARMEAVRAVDAKSRFLAAASHDLRQPFQAMSLFHHLLSQRLSDRRDVEICSCLGQALEAGRELLGALLDISTLDANLVQPKFESFPARQLIERIRADFHVQAEAKGLELRAVGSALVLRSDPLLLDRMLRNLVANAIRYTPTGRILIGCRRAGEKVRIEVWDTGAGIPDDQTLAIFEDFYQLDNAERDRNKGLGLGLSAVDRMARLLGHEVSVRSRVGAGSVFALTVATGDTPTAVAPEPVPA